MTLPKALRHRAQGARAHRSGAAFELELEEACRWLRARTIDPAGQVRLREERLRDFTMIHGPPLAVIARAHPPVSGRPGQLHFTGAGAVDFLGVFQDGQGRFRPVAFDAKVRSREASFAVDLKHHGERAQLDFLREWREAGGVAGYVVLDREAVTASSPEMIVGLGVVYAVTDLEALARGERVPVRRPLKGGRWVTPCVPYLDPSPVLTRPRWNLLGLLLAVAG